MTVCEPDPQRAGVLMSGSVSRKEFESCHPVSTAMRLRLVGVNYLLGGRAHSPVDGADRARGAGLGTVGRE